ncbi:3'(2'),5'-bisphosphate nucleotidase [Rodentibacter genomosp. 2]|uniref:3'(2'),5'-bisphosphate nucleotidase CysQ n=1 Tax=Rodentibacter genomosp. 2 TaxID=1908266 RepID=UPI000984AD0E|nr:3'(2'),5'-bisphosphate nucleotidase [Rodentibacter genomosp. 2]
MLPLNEHLLNQVLLIAYQAGNHLQRFYQQHINVQIKDDNTPVTEADLFVSQFLTEKLTALFPQTPVLSEENCHIPFEERQTWKEYWLIDPLDGTQQFINRTDQFSVLITLVRKNKPVLSVIHAPILSLTYYAMEDFGAFKKQGEQVKKLAKNTTDFNRTSCSPILRIAVGATTSQEKVRSILPKDLPCEFVVMGSSSLKSGLVAEGIVDCYVRLGQTGEWDTAGAEVLLGETNGQIFDPQFAPLTYNQCETLINPAFVMVADKSIDWTSIFRFN